jgi:hypothetical protein
LISFPVRRGSEVVRLAVSLRFGPNSALTAIQAVIHSLVAALLRRERLHELVHAETVRGADFATFENLHCGQAAGLRFFSYFSVRTEKYISFFFQKEKVDKIIK